MFDSKICQIFVPHQEDYEILQKSLSGYPISIITAEDGLVFDKPTQIIGWDWVKRHFPNHNILDKEIKQNLFWSFSQTEQKEHFFKEIENFVIKNLFEWLPKDFILIDPTSLDEIKSWILQVNKINKKYAYFHEGAMYFYDGENNFCFNLKNLELFYPKPGKIVSKILNRFKPLCFSTKNLFPYVDFDSLEYLDTLENFCWLKYGIEVEEPSFFGKLGENFRNIPFLMSILPSFDLTNEEIISLKRNFTRDMATQWVSYRTVSVTEEFKHDKLELIPFNRINLFKLNYSNKRTITNRIVCKDVFNIQNIEKESPEKKKIVSRFKGGKIVVFDYVSFETRISLYCSNNQQFIELYYDKDLHHELAKFIYQKDDVEFEQRERAKILSHSLIYGAGEERLINVLNGEKDVLKKLELSKKFLKPILDASQKIKETAQNRGYIVNEWGTIISPKKDFASFNNLIQSVASEIVVDKLLIIRKMLTNKKTKFLFQVHDSLILDFHPDELELIDLIGKELVVHNGMFFNVEAKIGENYLNFETHKTFIYGHF